MDFELSEEQRLLRDGLERLLSDRYGFEAREAYRREPLGHSAEMWGRFAEMGLLGLPFPEEMGGFGGGPVEVMIVAQALGAALAVEPYLSSVVLSGALLRAAGETRVVEAIAAGTATAALAHSEAQARYDLFDVTTTARPGAGGAIIDGVKTLVLGGGSADHLIVSARLSGGRRERAGLGLFLIAGEAAGVTRRGHGTTDGRRAAEITFAGAVARPLALAGDAADAIEAAVDAAIAALCAEAVGSMEALHNLTVEYLKTRKQFGKPIGEFQVLQHRAADMLVALEQARSMAMLAAMMVEEPDPVERRRAIASAKVRVARSARFIGQQAIQLHGGIGMALEYQAGHYFKHLTAAETLFGDADHHLGVLAGLPA